MNTAHQSSLRDVQATQVTFHQIKSILWPWRWLLLGAMLSAVFSAAAELAPPFIIKQLIDENLGRGQVEGLLALGFLYLAATAGVHVLGFGTAYLTAIAAQGALRQLRVRLFAHLQKLPISYYDRTPLGEVISRCTADLETINALFSSGVINVLTQALQLVASLAAMIVLSPLLSSFMLIVLPILYVMTRTFQVHMRQAERAVRQAVGVLSARLQETLAGVEIIRALHWEFRFLKRFQQTLHQTLLVTNRAVGYGSVYSPTLNILSAVIIALLFWSSTSSVFSAASISIGSLTAFILLFQQFFKPIISIGNQWQVVQSALAGVERVFQVLSLPIDASLEKASLAQPASKSHASRISLSHTDGALVEAANIFFGYSPGHEVLSGVSIVARPGEHVAVVGRTGAGKSSLFHLLGGLYKPWSGSVRLAGQDPYLLSGQERRKILGPVPQIVQLFTGTVLENITLWDEKDPIQAVERAAAISGADVFIRTLPHGYDTVLSNRSRGSGVQISVGQRQLLALTRALLGDPEILLLDEATSAMDSATEAAFRKALRSQLHDRGGTVLTIAHRLSTAIEASYIILLEHGQVIEEGSPRELLRRGGRLAAFWDLENAGWEWRASS